jgi:hypothetical protein
MRRMFSRRFAAIAVGSVSSATVGSVAMAGSFPTATRIVGGCLLIGALAAVGFWAGRFGALPVTARFTRWWLVGCYGVGVTALIIGVSAAAWAVTRGD